NQQHDSVVFVQAVVGWSGHGVRPFSSFEVCCCVQVGYRLLTHSKGINRLKSVSPSTQTGQSFEARSD
ncbi:hypothetical protein, partial [Pseudomonas atacamensis]|uniref:hypothetical protein n=1 Tax=Pseudomonas atacamensis TaxID=2565368 RepID=UPI00244A9F33